MGKKPLAYQFAAEFLAHVLCMSPNLHGISDFRMTQLDTSPY